MTIDEQDDLTVKLLAARTSYSDASVEPIPKGLLETIQRDDGSNAGQIKFCFWVFGALVIIKDSPIMGI